MMKFEAQIIDVVETALSGLGEIDYKYVFDDWFLLAASQPRTRPKNCFVSCF